MFDRRVCRNSARLTWEECQRLSEHLFEHARTSARLPGLNFVVFVANVSLKLKQLFCILLLLLLVNKLLLSNSSVALATRSAPVEFLACFGFHTNTLVI